MYTVFIFDFYFVNLNRLKIKKFNHYFKARRGYVCDPLQFPVIIVNSKSHFQYIEHQA